MTGLKFELDIDAEIQKLGLLPAKVAKSANRGEQNAAIICLYDGLPFYPDKPIHLEETARLYRDRGWIEIYSTRLDSKIYLVRDDKVEPPDTEILRYAPSEIDELRGLSVDDIKMMHEAKKAFGGVISRAE